MDFSNAKGKANVLSEIFFHKKAIAFLCRDARQAAALSLFLGSKGCTLSLFAWSISLGNS
ncbi:MAG: hypothetical protein WBG73_08300 [Coleofasciculaceae cyanobacterium]